MGKTYVFNVAMTCEGCSGAVKRIMDRNTDKILDFNIDLPGRKVTITSDLSKDEIEAILKKCGKEVNYVEEN